MNPDDFAIVIGISAYPELGEPPDPRADLDGPSRDAADIEAWLLDPRGGGLPAANVRSLTSDDFPPSARARGAGPTAQDITRLFEELEAIARAPDGTIGRRLYIYMAGHGFSPRPTQGCLFMADATAVNRQNIWASQWLEWFQDAGYFREYVLWLDCCMNRGGGTAAPVAFGWLASSNPAGPTFIGFAAQRPLRAVERSIAAGGPKRGLFTWALIEGLRGAAANRYGVVTGHSLADWLRNAIRSRMAPGDLADSEVAKEPEIIREDDRVVFGRGLSRTYTVTVNRPAADAEPLTLYSGRPPRPRVLPIAQQGRIVLNLRPGLYVVTAPRHGLRQGFEVAGDGVVDLVELGAPVAEPAEGALFAVTLDPENPVSENFIIDEAFNLVDRATGILESRIPYGLYKLKTRIGRETAERIVILDGDVVERRLAPPEISSAAPIAATAKSREYHSEAVRRSSERTTTPTRRAGRPNLTLMARVWSAADAPSPEDEPWQGIDVVDAEGRTVLDFGGQAVRRRAADLVQEGHPPENADPFATASAKLEPGAYFLRQVLNPGVTIEQTLIVPAGFALDVFVLRTDASMPAVREGRPAASRSLRPRVSILMRKADRPPLIADASRLLETARVALADERMVLNDELAELLLRKFKDPLAGIIGAHLLLIAQERDPTYDIGILDTVVGNLQRLVGLDHPDVQALSLCCRDEALRARGPVTAPPMFQRSWDLLVRGSAARTSLVSEALWRRAQAVMATPPFLVWNTDASAKREVVRQLVAITRGTALEADSALETLRTPRRAGSAPRVRPMMPGPAMMMAPEAPAITDGGRPPRRQTRRQDTLGMEGDSRTTKPSKQERASLQRTAQRLGLPQSALTALRRAARRTPSS